VSQPKFAPITSGLLARKGEASPSVGSAKLQVHWREWSEALERRLALAAPAQAEPEPEPERAAITAFISEHVRAVERQAAEANDHDHLRKVIIRLSREEHERLGIAAVKKGLTRNQLVRAALDAYAEALLQEYGTSCGCIAGNCDRRCDG
jgi:hypothetical protein